MISTKRFIETSEESISNYLKEVRKIDLLTQEEELELTKKISEGDKKAQDYDQGGQIFNRFRDVW